MKILPIAFLLLASAACAGPRPAANSDASPTTPSTQPTALADCVTAVGAERAQCRAQ